MALERDPGQSRSMASVDQTDARQQTSARRQNIGGDRTRAWDTKRTSDRTRRVVLIAEAAGVDTAGRYPVRELSRFRSTGQARPRTAIRTAGSSRPVPSRRSPT